MNPKTAKILKIGSAIVCIAIAVVFLWIYPDKKPEYAYYTDEGRVFGTYYKICYQADHDIQGEIEEALQAFDNSLSTFNDSSILSRINRNEEVKTDSAFELMFETAQKVAQASNGAFDITVAPLVNAWGFGFSRKEQVTQAKIDSLREFIGFHSISLFEHQVWKSDSRTMLDASAIAKGQSCDMVAEVLRKHGCKNLLVDIGGEVVCQGRNPEGQMWKVGITKPQDDPTGTKNELQEVISASALCMATSGNYRQFYYENGVRRSHTIDPRTGYPVSHSLLSATVVAPTCREADALATACMVLGKDSALWLIEKTPKAACYLICADADTLQVIKSRRFRY